MKIMTVSRIAKRLKWRRRAVYLPHIRPRPQPSDEPGAAPAPPPTPSASEPEPAAPSATDMIANAVRSVERQLAAIQSILDGHPAGRDTTEVERAMRTLSSITRTLYALRRLDAAAPVAPAGADDDDDDLPTDLDELRHALSARIEALVERRDSQRGVPDEPE